MGDKQPAKKGISMGESITFDSQNVLMLKQFFEGNKEKYDEIWIVITKKKVA
jgi:hypothetical protein